MKNVEIFDDKHMLAYAAANKTVTTLNDAVANTGQATWVLAGGSTPELAYQIIADRFIGALDWSKVTILIGDERIAPLDSVNSNWHKAEQLLLQHIPEARLLRPASDLPVNQATADYVNRLATLTSDGVIIKFDVVWLGVGEDGHTLSLFPGHDNLDDEQPSVIAVSGSPKPPAERISLTIPAVRSSNQCFILASGEGKANALHRAYTDDLPIARVARAIEQAGGTVTWLLDEPAARLL